MLDLRPSLEPLFAAFGVTATVTPPGGGAVATTVIVSHDAVEVPTDGALALNERRTRVTVRRDAVASLPSGSTIVTPAGSYVVDGLAGQDDELLVALVR